MRIVYFNYLYDLYGASIGSTRKAEYLFTALRNLGYDVKIYWRKGQPKEGENIGRKIYGRLKKYLAWLLHDPKIVLSNLKYFVEEYKIIKDEKPDLIIVRLETYVVSSVILAKLFKLPLIIEADAPAVYEERTFQHQYYRLPHVPEAIERTILKVSDKSICVSNVAKNYFIKQGVPKQKLEVISNGVDVRKFTIDNSPHEIREKFGIDGICVGFVGSFHLWHGVDNLMKIIEDVTAKFPQIKFLMVGQGGPMYDTFKQFVRANQLEDNVIFTGYVSMDDMPKYIAAMDIVLAPYPKMKMFHYSPVKIYEYMASGKPVIASRIGQIGEIIQDGHNGILCAPGNVAEMEEKLIDLIQDPEKRARIGRKAYETIIANHTWEKKAQQWAEICDSVFKSSKNRSVG